MCTRLGLEPAKHNHFGTLLGALRISGCRGTINYEQNEERKEGRVRVKRIGSIISVVLIRVQGDCMSSLPPHP